MNNRARISAIILITLPPLILFFPFILGYKVLFWGTPVLQFVPWRNYAAEVLSKGHLPLWNPLVGMGAPLFANYQSALLYPPNWIQFLAYIQLGIRGVAWGQAILVVLHLSWAGYGMLLLCREIGVDKTGRIVAAIAFQLSGYLIARAGFLSINASVAWLPWVLWGIHKLVAADEAPSSRWMGVLRLSVIVCMQLLAGHAQTTWYTLFLAILWYGFLSISGVKRARTLTSDEVTTNDAPVSYSHIIRSSFKGAVWLGLVYLLGMGMAAVQLLPTGEYLLESQRASAVAYDYALTYSYWPWRVLTLLAPSMFGSPVSGDYWGYGNFWEDHLYIGVLPLLFAFRGIWFSWQARQREDQPELYSLGKFLTIISVISFLLALGKNTPLYPWLYYHVPTFALFQAPTRWSLWVEIALVLLAAIGIHRFKRPVGRGLYWSRLGTAGAFAITLGAGITWLMIGSVSPTFIKSTALAGLWGSGTGILILFAPQQHPEETAEKTGSRIWQVSVALFVFLDLLVVGRGLNPGINGKLYVELKEKNRSLVEKLDGGRLFIPDSVEYRLKFERFMRFKSFSLDEAWANLGEVMLPNVAMLSHVPLVNNFDPLVPGRYATWMEMLNDHYEAGEKAPLNKMLNLMAVSLVEEMESESLQTVNFSARKPSPTVRWVPCFEQVSNGEQALAAITTGKYNLAETVIIEDAPPLFAEACEDENLEIQVTWDWLHPGEVVIGLENHAAGWLFLSNVWYPGWEVMVDGEKSTLYRANYLFQAVPLEPGASRVVLRYHPQSFTLGLIISLLSMATTGVLFIRARKQEPGSAG